MLFLSDSISKHNVRNGNRKIILRRNSRSNEINEIGKPTKNYIRKVINMAEVIIIEKQKHLHGNKYFHNYSNFSSTLRLSNADHFRILNSILLSVSCQLDVFKTSYGVIINMFEIMVLIIVLVITFGSLTLKFPTQLRLVQKRKSILEEKVEVPNEFTQ